MCGARGREAICAVHTTNQIKTKLIAARINYLNWVWLGRFKFNRARRMKKPIGSENISIQRAFEILKIYTFYPEIRNLYGVSRGEKNVFNPANEIVIILWYYEKPINNRRSLYVCF